MEMNLIDLDEYKSIGTYSIDLHFNGDSVTYFDSFRVEHIPKGIHKFIGGKNNTANIYRYKTMVIPLAVELIKK